MQQAVCPRCGSGAEVRTVSELFDMLNGRQAQAMQGWQNQQGQFPGQGPYPGQGQGQPGQAPPGGYSYAGTGYSDYGPNGNQYGSGNQYGPGNQYGGSFGGGGDWDSSGDIGQDIANAVLGSAFKFVGRGIAKKMQKAYQDRVVPAMQAKAAQTQQQWQQSQADQAAIVQRYPDLRGCLKDQVVFLEGGTRVIPISELQMPVTLAQADAVVDKLRAP